MMNLRLCSKKLSQLLHGNTFRKPVSPPHPRKVATLSVFPCLQKWDLLSLARWLGALLFSVDEWSRTCCSMFPPASAGGDADPATWPSSSLDPSRCVEMDLLPLKGCVETRTKTISIASGQGHGAEMKAVFLYSPGHLPGSLLQGG